MEGKFFEPDFDSVTTRKQKIGDAARKLMAHTVNLRAGARSGRIERQGRRALNELGEDEKDKALQMAKILEQGGGVVIPFPHPQARNHRLTREGE